MANSQKKKQWQVKDARNIVSKKYLGPTAWSLFTDKVAAHVGPIDDVGGLFGPIIFFWASLNAFLLVPPTPLPVRPSVRLPMSTEE